MNDDIFYKPRSGDEVCVASGGVPICPYSVLNDAAKILGIERLLRKMFSISRKYIILLQDPANMRSGHWMGLEFDPKKNAIYFFSSYGGKPDVEKRRWLGKSGMNKSHQTVDVFNDGLKELLKKGWEIHYNDHPYQFEGDHTATCGIWTVAFLNSNMNPEQFYRYNLRNHQGVVEYYRRYFRKK